MNDDLNTGGVLLGIEQRFAEQDARRRAELDRLIRAGKGNEEPPKRGPEVVMATCSICGKAGHNARSCVKRQKAKAEPKADAPVEAPEPTKARPAKGLQCGLASVRDTRAASVAELLETISACKAELAERRQRLQAELDQVAEALGGEAA